MASSTILDTDSEDELPAGWEERVTSQGKVYYANHSNESTQWSHPVTGKKKKVAGELPFGWMRKVNDEGFAYYVDHVSKKTTYTDPRLAFAVEDTDDVSVVRQKYDGSSTAEQVLLGRDLTGKYYIVTGANCGIGYETARSLAQHGGHVVMACRDMEAATKAATVISTERSNVKVIPMHCDLSSLASVKKFSEEYKSKEWPLNCVILNAGVFSMPYTVTPDGYEATFQINHLASFYLIGQLKDLLIQSAPSTVVSVSSESHRFTDLNIKTIAHEKLSPPRDKYRAMYAYNQSKLCNVLFTNELNLQLSKDGVTANSVHPGNMICSSLSRQWWVWRLLFTLVRPFTKSKQQGAATSVYCATAREIAGVGGCYYNNCFQCPPADEAMRRETCKALWKISEKMVKLADTLVSDGGINRSATVSDSVK